MVEFAYIFIPALLIIVLIRIDAKLVGPYFSVSELLPGFGYGPYAFMGKTTLHFALIRRLAYPLIMGVILYIIYPNFEIVLLAGLMTGFLLVWPAWISPRPPAGVSFHDIRYHLFYFGVLLAGGFLALLGVAVVELVLYFSEGDVWRFLAENAFIFIMGGVVGPITIAFTAAVGKSLTDKAEARQETYQSHYPDDDYSLDEYGE